MLRVTSPEPRCGSTEPNHSYRDELLFNDPKAGADALFTRAKQLDRESIVALVSSRPDISPEQAEQMADKIEEARDSVIRKAEEVSKTASVAAWWVFAAALLSGIAAAAGGIVAAIS